MREDRLAELRRTLRQLVRDDVSEASFQSWFETNPDAFEILGFRRALPKPRLPLSGDQFLEPDFMVQDFSGMWSIFELKRPSTVVLKKPARRRDLQAEFSSYVQQCREYSNYFVQDANRDQIRERYGIDVQRTVPSLILAATSDAVDVRAVNDLLVERGGRVALQTYTEVLGVIGRELASLTSDRTGAKGLTLLLLCALPPTAPDQFLLDFGSRRKRDRLSVIVTDREFRFEIRASSGDLHALRVRRPLVHTNGSAQPLTLLEVEVAEKTDAFHIGARLDRTCVVQRTEQSATLNVLDPLHLVVGSDMRATTPACFGLLELAFWNRTLSPDEREQAYQYIDETYRYYLSPLAAVAPYTIRFLGPKHVSTLGHPVCPTSEPLETVPRLDPSNRGPVAWYRASNVSLASGKMPTPDPHVCVSATPLPGMSRDP